MESFTEAQSLNVTKDKLVTWVIEYWQTWQRPLPLRLVSARWTKEISYRGGRFREVYSQLIREGRLRAIMTETGGTHVLPPTGNWAAIKKGYTSIQG